MGPAASLEGMKGEVAEAEEPSGPSQEADCVASPDSHIYNKTHYLINTVGFY